MRFQNNRAVLAGTVGLLPWLAAQWIAFGLAAGGDGWNAPFFLTPPLLLLYPFVSSRSFAAESGATRGDQCVLLAAVVLDFVLLRNVLQQEHDYFLKALSLAGYTVAAWVVLWSGWQVLAIVTILKKVSPATDS